MLTNRYHNPYSRDKIDKHRLIITFFTSILGDSYNSNRNDFFSLCLWETMLRLFSCGKTGNFGIFLPFWQFLAFSSSGHWLILLYYGWCCCCMTVGGVLNCGGCISSSSKLAYLTLTFSPPNTKCWNDFKVRIISESSNSNYFRRDFFYEKNVNFWCVTYC